MEPACGQFGALFRLIFAYIMPFITIIPNLGKDRFGSEMLGVILLTLFAEVRFKTR